MENIPRGYCECGCGQKTNLAHCNSTKHGWVKGEPLRFLKGHHRRYHGPEYEVKDCGYETPCWVWLMSKTTAGYGKRGRDYAHRLYYERAHGPIPQGLSIHHRCANRSCCNPNHLQAVTHAENCRLGARTKTSAETVSDIRYLHYTGRYGNAELGKMFGFSKQHIREIVTGSTWT